MIKKRRLKLLGHVARFPDGADSADAHNSWSGMVEKDLKPHNIGLHTARKLAKDREKWSRFVHDVTLPP